MESCEWVDEAQRILRMVISIPLFTRREIVCQVVADHANKLIMFKSVQTDKCPIKSDVIRAEMIDCWQLTEKDGVLISKEVMSFDLGGWIPVSMMNMLMGSSVATEYATMYTKLKKIQGIQ